MGVLVGPPSVRFFENLVVEYSKSELKDVSRALITTHSLDSHALSQFRMHIIASADAEAEAEAAAEYFRAGRSFSLHSRTFVYNGSGRKG